MSRSSLPLRAPLARTGLTAALLATVGMAATLTSTSAAAARQALPTPPASAQPQKATPGSTFRLATRATGLKAPIWVGAAPGDATGLWVAQQNGQLLRLQGTKKTLKLSVATRTKAEGEQGLLGVAFLPGYATNKLVVLHFTNRSGNTRVELWRVGSSPKKAKLVRTLLTQKQPFPNHNGGQLTFGQGDDLYLGLGDGGAGDDPQRNGQNLNTKLGKILVATVTATNKPSWKIAAYGLRNPWRFWFDPTANELWVADVGQNEIEEIDRIPLGSSTPPNLGWSVFEGGQRDANGDDALSGSGALIWPVITYRHDDDGGCSVTGGEIYRGSAVPALVGRYVYGDYCNGHLWSVEPDGKGVGPLRLEAAGVPQLSSFGHDAAGELYAASHAGTIYQLKAK